MGDLTYAFATLEPRNIAAKLDFDALAKRSNGQSPEYVHIDDKRRFDAQVARFTAQTPDDWDGATSTDCDTDYDDKGGWIYHGRYVLDLAKPPQNPRVGWKICGDLKLGLNYRGMRSAPANFNFHRPETGCLSLFARPRLGISEVAVCGRELDYANTYNLNQNPMSIRIGGLEYEFKYTEYASTSAYALQRKNYLKDYFDHGGPVVDIAPTPAGQVRTFGQWTINCALGKGSFGRVHFATNEKGQVAVVKIVDGKRSLVQNEISMLQFLEPLSARNECKGRLVRLLEVIEPDGFGIRAGAPFEEVAIVLEPCVPFTLASMCKSSENGSFGLIQRKLARETLSLLNSLHEYGVIHGDLKPENIGYMHDHTVVLLDLGGALKCASDEELKPQPGRGGTVGYLAPEREMEHYGQEIDVWSFGIVLYQIVFGAHPWPSDKNPWRPDHKHMQEDFLKSYKETMQQLKGESRLDLMRVCDLLLGLLQKDPKVRITCKVALQHPALRSPEEEGPKKRIRI